MKYIELKKNYCNLYCVGSPLILSAYALLQDSESKNVILQLKMTSVAKKNISAVIVAANALDVTGSPLSGIAEYHYLDLSVPCGQSFGQSSAIVLPDANTRDVKVAIRSVVFDDGSKWFADTKAQWRPIPGEVSISEVFNDPELEDYYLEVNGWDCCYVPAVYTELGLWRCAANHINTADEKECCFCGREFSEISVEEYAQRKKVHDEELAAKAEADRIEAEKAALAHKARVRKSLRIGGISLAAAAVIALVVLAVVLWIPLKKAQALYDAGEFEAALAASENIPGKDALQLSESCSAKIEEARLAKEAQEKAQREAAALETAHTLYDSAQYREAIESMQGFDSAEIDELREECKKAIDRQFLSDVEFSFVQRYEMVNGGRPAEEYIQAEMDILEKYSECYDLFYDSTIQQCAQQYIDGVRTELEETLDSTQSSSGYSDKYKEANAARRNALLLLCKERDLFSDNEFFKAFIFYLTDVDFFNNNVITAYWNDDYNCYTVTYTNTSPYTFEIEFIYGIYRKDTGDAVSQDRITVKSEPGSTEVPLKKLHNYSSKFNSGAYSWYIEWSGSIKCFDPSGDQLLPIASSDM